MELASFVSTQEGQSVLIFPFLQIAPPLALLPCQGFLLVVREGLSLHRLLVQRLANSQSSFQLFFCSPELTQQLLHSVRCPFGALPWTDGLIVLLDHGTITPHKSRKLIFEGLQVMLLPTTQDNIGGCLVNLLQQEFKGLLAKSFLPLELVLIGKVQIDQFIADEPLNSLNLFPLCPAKATLHHISAVTPEDVLYLHKT